MTQPVQDASLGVALVVLATGAIGLLLMLAGQRLLSTLLAVAGIACGGLLGWASSEAIATVSPSSLLASPWILGGAGAALGAVVGALLTRLAAAVALAAILALAGWMGVASASRHGWIAFAAPTPQQGLGAPSTAPSEQTAGPQQPASATSPTALALEAGLLEALRASVREGLDRAAAPLRTPAAQQRLGGLAQRVADGVELLRSQWDVAPPPTRTMMLACAAMCGFVGLCFGLVAARWAAALVTAIVGSALLVLAAAACSLQFFEDEIPGPPLSWLLVWAALAMAGTMVQWRRPDSNESAA